MWASPSVQGLRAIMRQVKAPTQIPNPATRNPRNPPNPQPCRDVRKSRNRSTLGPDTGALSFEEYRKQCGSRQLLLPHPHPPFPLQVVADPQAARDVGQKGSYEIRTKYNPAAVARVRWCACAHAQVGVRLMIPRALLLPLRALIISSTLLVLPIILRSLLVMLVCTHSRSCSSSRPHSRCRWSCCVSRRSKANSWPEGFSIEMKPSQTAINPTWTMIK
jgi:hypothetical protein